MTRGVKGTRNGRMKPCQHCAKPFYCEPSQDVGGTLQEKKYCSKACYTAYWRRPEVVASFFWTKVDKRGPDECWLWTGAKFKPKPRGRQMGYGRYAGNGPFTYAHRVAWMLTNGPIPSGMLVMHKCDVPLCCNPAHMQLGTDRDNHMDKVAKGRHRGPARRSGN